MGKESVDEILREALMAKETPSPQLQEQLEQKLSGRQRKLRISHGAAVAAGFLLVVTVLGVTVFSGSIQAMMERIFGTITESYVDGNAVQKEQAEEEVCKVGETVTKQGVGITLEEVLVDANKIVYSMKVNADSSEVDVSGEELYLNGQKLSGAGSGISWHQAEENAEVIVNEKQLNNMALSGDVQVQLRIKSVKTDSAVIEDNWNFETTVNVDKANSHTTREKMGIAVKLENGDVMVFNEVVRTSTDCKLYVTYQPKESYTQDIYLHVDGQDEDNNPITSSGIYMKAIKGTEDYEMIVTLDGVTGETKKMTLAPYELAPKTYEYRQIGGEFTVEFE